MALIALRFRGLHPDASALPDDLARLYRLVADEFEVAIDDEPFYREVEFPVLELAQALDSWLRHGMPNRSDFEFEPMGGESLALLIRPIETGWTVNSSQSAPDVQPPVIGGDDLAASVQRFLHDVTVASAAIGVDFEGMLQRFRRYSNEHGAGERGG